MAYEFGARNATGVGVEARLNGECVLFFNPKTSASFLSGKRG